MRVGSRIVRIVTVAGLICGVLWGQSPAVVSISQAQQIALRNHPRIASAELAAQAAGFVVKQVRAAYYPTLSGNVSGVGTEHGSVLSAGAVTTSSIFSRQSSGFVASQLLTDFGRTASLEQSAKLRNASENQIVTPRRSVNGSAAGVLSRAGFGVHFNGRSSDAGSSAPDAPPGECAGAGGPAFHIGRQLRAGERVPVGAGFVPRRE